MIPPIARLLNLYNINVYMHICLCEFVLYNVVHDSSLRNAYDIVMLAF